MRIGCGAGEVTGSSADANGLLEPVGIGWSGAASPCVGSVSSSDGIERAGNGGGAAAVRDPGYDPGTSYDPV